MHYFFLMQCASCGRSLGDAAFPGGSVRCSCGAATAIPARDRASRPPEGGVYRVAAERSSLAGLPACPFCGGACSSDNRVCPHCNVELASVRCPHCFALHFLGSRTCGRCGQELQLEPLLDAADAPCPRCDNALRVATGGGGMNEALEGLAVLHECPACAGVFLDNTSLHRVLARGGGSHPAPDTPAVTRGEPGGIEATPEQVRYLKCPLCSQPMNRVNFGRRSGVIVDVCTPHGTWFDAGELARAIEFVARGGLEESRRLDAEEKRQLARTAARLEAQLASSGAQSRAIDRGIGRGSASWRDQGSSLLEILAGLFR